MYLASRGLALIVANAMKAVKCVLARSHRSIRFIEYTNKSRGMSSQAKYRALVFIVAATYVLCLVFTCTIVSAQPWTRHPTLSGCLVNGVTYDTQGRTLICDVNQGLRLLNGRDSCGQVIFSVDDDDPTREYQLAYSDNATGTYRSDIVCTGDSFRDNLAGTIYTYSTVDGEWRPIILPSGKPLAGNLRLVGRNNTLHITPEGAMHVLDEMSKRYTSMDMGRTFSPEAPLFEFDSKKECQLSTIVPSASVTTGRYDIGFSGDSIKVRRNGVVHSAYYRLSKLNPEACNQFAFSDIFQLGDDTIVVVAMDGGLHATTNSGQSWSSASKGTGLLLTTMKTACFTRDEVGLVYRLNFGRNSVDVVQCRVANIVDTLRSLVANGSLLAGKGRSYYWYSSDTGQSWDTVATAIPSYDLHSVSANGELLSLSRPMTVLALNKRTGQWESLFRKCESFGVIDLTQMSQELGVTIGHTEPLRVIQVGLPATFVISDGKMISIDSIAARWLGEWPNGMAVGSNSSHIFAATDNSVLAISRDLSSDPSILRTLEPLGYYKSFVSISSMLHVVGRSSWLISSNKPSPILQTPSISFPRQATNDGGIYFPSSVTQLDSVALVSYQRIEADVPDVRLPLIVDVDVSSGSVTSSDEGISQTKIVGMASDGQRDAIVVAQRVTKFAPGPAYVYVRSGNNGPWRYAEWNDRVFSSVDKNVDCTTDSLGTIYIIGRGLDSIIISHPPYSTYHSLALPSLGTNEWPTAIAINQNKLFLGTTRGLYSSQLALSVDDEDEIPLFYRMGVRVFPNPGKSQINVELYQTKLPSRRTLHIVDAMGSLIKDCSSNIPAESNVTVETQIDVSDVPSGQYFLVFSAGEVSRSIILRIAR